MTTGDPIEEIKAEHERAEAMTDRVMAKELITLEEIDRITLKLSRKHPLLDFSFQDGYSKELRLIIEEFRLAKVNRDRPAKEDMLIPEDIDLDYSLGNIILSNHIQTEKRVKMLREIFELHGYAQLAKSKDVCPECNDMGEIHDRRDGLMYDCPTCQGTGKRDRPEKEISPIRAREKALGRIVGASTKIKDRPGRGEIERILEYVAGLSPELRKEVAGKILALFDRKED